MEGSFMQRHKTSWVLVLNGTSSVGKTTLAKEYIAKFDSKIALLQIDAEVIPVFVEELSDVNQQYNSSTDFWVWFEHLPKETKDRVLAKEDALFKEACRRMIEHAKNLNRSGINVIIDTVLFEYEGESYNFFKTAFEKIPTFFVLTYAPLDVLLKNVKKRNIAFSVAEKRSFLDPFFLFFAHVFRKCALTASEKLDVLTKAQFETLCVQLEDLIDNTEKERLQKLKTIVAQQFFGPKDEAVGIAAKYAYDFIVNTGEKNLSECSNSLHEWLESHKK